MCLLAARWSFLWLSEPIMAVATASGVLAGALPALRLMSADEEMRQVLAAADGPHEWEPLAAALRRRVPRRVATRLLPKMRFRCGCRAHSAFVGRC